MRLTSRGAAGPGPSPRGAVERGARPKRSTERALENCGVGGAGDAARATLSYREQRQAARLFDDPDEAEDLRMSDNRRDEAFWERYQAFGETAQAMCS